MNRPQISQVYDTKKRVSYLKIKAQTSKGYALKLFQLYAIAKGMRIGENVIFNKADNSHRVQILK